MNLFLLTTCCGCGKPRHVEVDYPINQNKEKSLSRKACKGRRKKTYIMGREWHVLI